MKVNITRSKKEHRPFDVVFISGITATLKKCIRHHQAIEPVIGHLKSDGLLGHNYLKGELGDRMNVVLYGTGHNLRLGLSRLRSICLDFPDMIFSAHTLCHYFCCKSDPPPQAARGQVPIRWSRSYSTPMAASSRRWLSLGSVF